MSKLGISIGFVMSALCLSACSGQTRGTERHTSSSDGEATGGHSGDAPKNGGGGAASSTGGGSGGATGGETGGTPAIVPGAGGLPITDDCGMTFAIETPLPTDLARVQALTAHVCVNALCVSSDFSNVEPATQPYTSSTNLLAERMFGNTKMTVLLIPWLGAGQARFEPFGDYGLTVEAWIRPATGLDGDVWKVDLVEPSGQSFYRFEQSVYYMTYDSRVPQGGLCRNAVIVVKDGGSPVDAEAPPDGS